MLNHGITGRLARLERALRPLGASRALFADLDNPAVYRDAAGAVYTRDPPTGRIRDEAGAEVVADPLIIVEYEKTGERTEEL